MQTFMKWNLAHPRQVVLFLIAVTLLAATQAINLRIDTSPKGLMIHGDASEEYYFETIDRFVSDSITVIYIRDKDVFTPQKLKSFEDLAFKLEELPGLTKIESLFNFTNIKSSEGMLINQPLLDFVPDTQEEVDQIKRDALNNNTLVGNMISEDGLGVAINLYLDPKSEDPDFLRNTAEWIENALKPFEDKFETVWQFGTPFNVREQTNLVISDQLKLVPPSIILILGLVIVILRTKVGAILPILTAGTSVVWMFGAMGFLGIPVTTLTLIVPSLLFIIGSTEDIHLLSEYLEGVHQKKEKEKDLASLRKLGIDYMMSKLGTAIVLTAVTTFLGFASIMVNQIDLLKQFGMAASVGLFVNPLVTFMLVPIFLAKFGPIHGGGHEDSKLNRFLKQFAEKIILIIHKHKWAILGLSLFTAVLFASLGARVEADNNPIGFFKEDSKVVKRINELHRSLSGGDMFFIRINGREAGAFRKPENLRKVEELKKYMEDKGWFDKAITFTDYMKLIHREMNGGDPEFFRIPDSSNSISEYSLMLQDHEIEAFITHEFDELNILVRHNNHSSAAVKKILDELLPKAEGIFPEHFEVGVTGELVLINLAVDSIVKGQILSIGLIAVIIFIVMSVLFMNMKAGLLSLVPNLFPVALIFGVMYLFKIPLDSGTCMVSAIALGVAVDDTIHFMTRYNKEMRAIQDQEKAMEECIRIEILPVFTSSLALAAGFSILMFSEFMPIVNFGFLASLALVFAFIGDMLLTPILLSSTQLITIWDMAALHLRKEVLQGSKLFEGMKSSQIKRVVLLGQPGEIEQGGLVVSKGDYGESMYIILEGECTAFAKDEKTGEEVVFTTLHPGEIFGEMALINPGERTANLRAETPISYIELTMKSLQRIQKVYPWVAGSLFLNISKILGTRLASTNIMLLQKGNS